MGVFVTVAAVHPTINRYFSRRQASALSLDTSRAIRASAQCYRFACGGASAIRAHGIGDEYRYVAYSKEVADNGIRNVSVAYCAQDFIVQCAGRLH